MFSTMTLTLTETVETKGYDVVQREAPAEIAAALKQCGVDGVAAVAGTNNNNEWVVVVYNPQPTVRLRAAVKQQ